MKFKINNHEWFECNKNPEMNYLKNIGKDNLMLMVAMV